MSSLLRIRIRIAVEEARELEKLLRGLSRSGGTSSKLGGGAGGGAKGPDWGADLRKQYSEAAKMYKAQRQEAERAALGAAASWAKSYSAQYAEFSKMLAQERKARDAFDKDTIRRFQQAMKTDIGGGFKDSDEAAKAAAAAAKARQAIDGKNESYTRKRLIDDMRSEIGAGYKASEAKMKADAIAAERKVALEKWLANIQVNLNNKVAQDEVDAAERVQQQKRYMFVLNANLHKKIEEDRIADELNLERNKLRQIATMTKMYQAGMIKGSEYKTGVNAFKGAKTGGTANSFNVQLAAAGATKKYDDALAAAAKRQAEFDERVRRSQPTLIGMGKNVQWVGRQLEYNFTVPIMRIGRTLFDTAIEVDKQITKLAKVYDTAGTSVDHLDSKMVTLGVTHGKLSANASTLDRDAYRLGQSMSVLSQIYGVQIGKVTELEAMWAATGLTGLDLARATELTLQMMVAGDIDDQTEAFNIANQAMQGYGVTVKELEPILAAINTAENITAAQFTDIAKVIARSASSAKAYGVPLEELVGIATVLTPAFGSAETAGNGLKSMLTKIMAPTDKARTMLQELGLNVDESAWQSTNATGRLKLLGEAMKGLTREQKAQAEAVIFGIYQINRANGVIDDYMDAQSQALAVEQALKAARDGDSETIAKYRGEIDLYLRSTKVGIDRAKATLVDLGGKILAQMLPTVLIFANALGILVRKFAEMDDSTRNFIVIAIFAVAALGPIMRLSGAFIQLVGVFGYVAKAIGWIIGMHGGQVIAAEAAAAAELEAAGASNASASAAGRKGLASLLTNPWFLLAAAVVTATVLIYKFRDDLAPVFAAIKNFILRAFNALPAGIQNALIAVVTIVRNAALAVYGWLSYINPFAKHSPSLVDQVTAGVDLIARKYATLANVGAVFRKAAGDLAAFKDAAAGALNAGQNAERAKTRESVAETNPEAVPALDNLFGSLDQLKGGLAGMQSVIDAQQAVVDDLQKSYDALSGSIDSANDELDKQRDIASELKDQLDAAKAEADKWASAPIQGMKAFTDAIFDNELQQKKLRLAMMDIEDAVGPLDKLQQKMANLSGEIEQMRAMQTDLRQAGAGSEVTGPIEDQINALETQRVAFEDQIKPLQDMQDELDALQRAGERLDLEEAIKFDPLRKQIDDAANAIEEFPFDVIMGGLIDAQKRVMDLTKAYDDQQEKVHDQEAVVKGLEDARKLLNTQLDVEKVKLDELNGAYKAYEDQIRAIESAISDLTSAISDAKAAADDAADSLLSSGVGDFPEGDVPTGDNANAGGDFDAWLADQQKKLDDLLGGMNPFKKLQEAWDKFKKWWHENVDFTNLMSEMHRGLDAIDGAIDFGGVWDGVKDGISGFVSWAEDTWDKFSNSRVWKQTKETWNQLKDTASTAWDVIKKAVQDTVDKLGPKFAQFSDLVAPLGEAFSGIGGAISLAFGIALRVADLLVTQFMVIWEVILKFVDFLLPLWNIFWDQVLNIVGFAIDMVYNVIKFWLGIITGDWGMAWDAIKGVFIAVWDLMKGSLQTTLDFFDWAWDHIKSAASTAADWVKEKVIGGFNAIVDYAYGFVSTVIGALGDVGHLVWDYLSSGFTWMKDQVGSVIDGIVDFFTKLPERIKNLVSGVKEAAKDIGRAILDGIVDMLTSGINLGANLAQSIYGGIAGAINNVLTAVENKLNGLKIPTPVGDINFPNVTFPKMPPRLHTGGIVPGVKGIEVPAVLQAGEGVLSLSDMAAFEHLFKSESAAGPTTSSKTSNRTVNLYGDLVLPNIQSGDDADELIANLEALAVN